ncbi:molybdopterin-binding protein [Jannaschia sp. W003]|uniref:molybdopterin-binding protein n=1 Tax=Jannaschia sp. W003 TaxID=2867012 RepID=UPI0021A433BA|nr:molybdopterin-binding protein [Jannaschia sp. W003]UWQ21409.1 molybdopterin molybdenumtransferase MoeA [Jannaschia sp. W003]
MRFDLVVAADWSSAATPSPARPSADAIWVCADLRGEREVRYFRTRHAALAWIDALLAQGHRTLLGFDFAYGFPRGFAEVLTGRAEAIAAWDWLAERVRDGADNGNNRFEVAAQANARFGGIGPFWGHPQGRDYPGLPARKSAREGLTLPEHRRCEGGSGAKSVWQIAYSGSVGGQTLVGLPALARLRRTHPDLAVWPQQTGFAVPDARIVLAEIYPSLFDDMPHDHPIRDARQVAATAAALRAMPDAWFTAPAAVPDAARVAREEGWILGVGPEGSLVAKGSVDPGASEGAGPQEAPAARAPNDCFALPPGIRWTPVDEAMATLSRLEPVAGEETVPVGEAAGRVLARDVAALRSNPPRPNAAVDGWGFAHPPPEGAVPIAEGRAAAGQPFAGAVAAGHALRILTGAALPEGVDTVVLQEDAEADGGALRLRHEPKRGANTRRAGEDVEAGDPILRAGARLRPTDLALAIAAGHGRLPVRARLRVAVLSTGDEIVPPGATGEGIFDANRPMLLAMLAGWGMRPVDLGHVGDDVEALAAALNRGAEADAILTSGGASAGDEDHLSRLLGERGTVSHWRIAIKPGRPLALGRWRGTPLFGLPGNPVAAFTCAALLARPALLRMAGAPWSEPRTLTVPAAFAKRKKAGRREVLRARLDARGHAEVFASEGSGRVSGLSWAEGFVVLPDEAMTVEPGDPVHYLPFTELGLG